MKKIIICDIDGTIANLRHRLHYIQNEDGSKKRYKDTDWDSFHAACIDDEPYRDVIEIIQSHVESDYPLYLFSGRNEAVRSETVDWLNRYISAAWWRCRGLKMRQANDRRPDTVVKLEMMQELGFTPNDVLCIYDDRQNVVDMWRENGFRVLQVDAWQDANRT